MNHGEHGEHGVKTPKKSEDHLILSSPCPLCSPWFHFDKFYWICESRATCILSHLLLGVKKAMIPPLVANLFLEEIVYAVFRNAH